MPNTLVHIALQNALMYPVQRCGVLMSMILAGCVIPDFPWIAQRLLQWLNAGIDPIQLRAYSTIQASLFVSLIAAVACSTFYKRYLVAWAVIALGCGLHLLLDASQIKWGNGVNLAAPIDWRMTNFGFIWADHELTLWLSAFGLLIMVLQWNRLVIDAGSIVSSRRRWTIFLFALLVYVSVPYQLRDKAINADLHFMNTLLEYSARAGKSIDLDRRPLKNFSGKCHVEVFTGELLRLESPLDPCHGTYSLRARFTDSETLRVENKHRHVVNRDILSIIGLTLILGWFGHLLRRRVGQISD